MAKKGQEWNQCSECGRKMQRCLIASVNPDGSKVYVCRPCWKDLKLEDYMYEHRNIEESNR